MSFDVTQNPSPDAAEGPMQALSMPTPPATPAPAYGDPGQPAAPPQAPSDPAAKPSLWKSVVVGALSGLAGAQGSTSFGGGVAGGAAGSIQNEQRKIQNQHAATQQQQQIKFQDAQTAAMVTDSAMKQRQIDQMPEELKLQQAEGARKTAEYLTSIYGPPTQITQYDPNDPTDAAAHASLSQAAATNGGVVPPTATVHVGDTLLHWNANDMANSPSSLSHINDAAHLLNRPEMAPADYQRLKPNDRISQMSALMSLIEPDTAVDAGKVNGALVGAKQALAAAPKDANPQLLGLLKQRVDFLQATHDANLSDQLKVAGGKADISGRKALEVNQGKLDQAKVENPEWRPKVGADEKKKAELAENIAENANMAASILQKRSDLFGAAAGRYTTVQQMIGNNDPDIAQLGTIIHNIAMANSGVHGFRSQEGVRETEQLILNNFKNGPQSVGRALKALTTSTQTFINTARPEGYRTHSKQGGALVGMQQQ